MEENNRNHAENVSQKTVICVSLYVKFYGSLKNGATTLMTILQYVTIYVDDVVVVVAVVIVCVTVTAVTASVVEILYVRFIIDHLRNTTRKQILIIPSAL